MAKKKPEKDNLLTVMARTVGTALGAVTSKVGNLTGSNSGKISSNPPPKNKKAQIRQRDSRCAATSKAI